MQCFLRGAGYSLNLSFGNVVCEILVCRPPVAAQSSLSSIDLQLWQNISGITLPLGCMGGWGRGGMGCVRVFFA